MIDLSRDVRPISDLKSRAAEIVSQVRETRRPVLLTRHGRGVAVVLDVEEYERLTELTGGRDQRVRVVIDTRTAERIDRAAEQEGVPPHHWLADLVEQRTAAGWPPVVRELAGSWADFPEVEELRTGLGEDTPRHSI